MEEEDAEIIWCKGRVISALNRTRPPEVVTTIGSGRGKEVSAVVAKTWDLGFAENSGFELGVESESMRKEPTTESISCVSYVGSVTTPEVSAE